MYFSKFVKHFISPKVFNLSIFIILLFIQFEGNLLSYFENNTIAAILSQNTSIIDITDYHNLYPLITADKNIYTGMPPNKTCETISNIINITAAATYDTNHILLACTGDYLLSKINIYTGEEVPLVNYSKISLSIENLNYTCSISILNNIVYIGTSQILGNYLKHNIIKINLTNQNENNGPILDGHIIFNTLDLNLINLGDLSYPRQLSCEVISNIVNIEDLRLICGYLKYETSKEKYYYYVNVVNKDFSGFPLNTQKAMITSLSISNFRLLKINSTFIRFLFRALSYEIYLYKYSKIQ